MPKLPAIDRPVKLTTTLPESVRAPLDLHLWSEVEGRVPKGAYQAFIVERVREFFGWGSVDMAVIGFPGQVVRGPKEICAKLHQYLERL